MSKFEGQYHLQKEQARAFSSFFAAVGIALTCQDFVVSNVLATSFDCCLMLRNRNSFKTMAKQRYNNSRIILRISKLVKIR